LKPILGIDLGTTRSVVGVLDESGKPKILVNTDGELTTPSVVCFDDSTILVGRDALRMVPHGAPGVVQFAKREMGNPDYKVHYKGTDYSATMVQSFVLAKIRRDAAAALGRPVEAAVITVPAFFDEAKRRDTMDAGFLASLDVKAILNEPTAAAIAYGLHHGWLDRDGQFKAARSVLVYDLGGGTFDVSLVDIEPRRIKVIAVDGNSRLGGLDWDRCIADWIVNQFEQTGALDPAEIESAMPALLYEAEQLKQSLSVRAQVPVRLKFFHRSLDTTLSRDQFEDLTAHLLDRTRFTVKKLLESCGRETSQLNSILLVGGSTRMPQVTKMLKQRFGVEVDQSISPDHAVAAGAAIYAGHRLYEKNQEFDATPTHGAPVIGAHGADGGDRLTVHDVNAHDLGVLGVEIKTGRQTRHIMIPKNTPIPAVKSSRFQTYRDGQRSVRVRVIEGGDARGNSSINIGTFRIAGLRAGLKAGTPVDVTFRYDANGLLHVSAIIPSTGDKASIDLERPGGLTTHRKEVIRDELDVIFEALDL
jgi:molecular chaperone DnaK